jgi:hypothetical protein
MPQVIAVAPIGASADCSEWLGKYCSTKNMALAEIFSDI